MKVEEVYQKLIAIRDKAKNMSEDSFDKTKAFKYVHNAVLNLIDDMSYIDDQNDLLDDDWQDKKPVESTPIPKRKELIDLDDLI